MSVRLLVKQRSQAGGSDKGTEVLLEEEEIVLGRDKTAQVVLAEQAVSRSHAKITRDGALCFLEDLGSAYGTLINGKTLPKGEKRLLRNGDVIGIAQFDLTFDRIADARISAKNEKTSLVARQVVKDVMRGLGTNEGPFFRIMNGPNEGQKIEISNAQELTFGREGSADIVLRDDLVSRKHAKVRRDWSGTHVEDLESRNGIKVNRKRIARKTLHDKDELEIGGVRLLYLDPSEVREGPVVLAQEEEDGVEPTVAKEPEAPAEPPPAEEEAVLSSDAQPQTPLAQEGLDPEAGLDGQGMLGEDGYPLEGDELPPSGLLARFGLSNLSQARVWVPVAAISLFAVLALVLTILVLAGA